MNANVPTDICFSFAGFKARGGRTDHHKDGWGVAFFDGKGVRKFLDPQPSCESPIAEFIKTYPIRSLNVIAHIRRATQGQLSLENTHPFQRELWGRYWIFAHNGNLKDFQPKLDGYFQPVGQTDSELAFCYIMQSLLKKFGLVMPPQPDLIAHLQKITTEINNYGEFNFMLSYGDNLLVHCSTRLSYIERSAPFRELILKDEDVKVDLSHETSVTDRAVIVATIPLTENEKWVQIPQNTLVLFHLGQAVQQWQTGDVFHTPFHD